MNARPQPPAIPVPPASSTVPHIPERWYLDERWRHRVAITVSFDAMCKALGNYSEVGRLVGVPARTITRQAVGSNRPLWETIDLVREGLRHRYGTAGIPFEQLVRAMEEHGRTLERSYDMLMAGSRTGWTHHGRGDSHRDMLAAMRERVRKRLHEALTSTTPATERDDWCLLRSRDGSTRDAPLWWRPNRAGYTEKLHEAGTYTRKEAMRLERGAPEKIEVIPVANAIEQWRGRVNPTMARLLAVDLDQVPSKGAPDA